MRNYEKEAKQINKVRNKRLFVCMLFLYRVIRYAKEPSLSKEYIYDMIDHFFGENCLEKNKIYRDVKRFCFANGKVVDNYFRFCFFGLTKKERKNYTIESRTSLVYDWGYFNQFDYYKYFEDKYLFAQTFSIYFRRDIILLNDKKKFEQFCQKHNYIFLKPRYSYLGQGISIENVSTKEKIESVWKAHKDDYIAEEAIQVEQSLKEFHPASANALRVVTVITSRGPEVLCAYVRFGNKGNIVEHMKYGSIGAAIDINSGIVLGQGIDKYNRTYTFHPFSEKKIVGYEFKNWDKLISMVKEMALVIPQVRLVGWDMVIDKNGNWLTIEGNHNPGFDISQIVLHKGLQKRLEEIMVEDKEG